MIEEILNIICDELPESVAISFLDSYAKIYADNPDILGSWAWIVDDANFDWCQHSDLLLKIPKIIQKNI